MNPRPYTYPVKRLVTSPNTGAWCRLPYPGHTNGCPNYNNAAACPPVAPQVRDFFDLEKPLYLGGVDNLK